MTPLRFKAATFTLVFASLAIVATAAPASARRSGDATSRTGLPGIFLDRVPPDVVFDTGDGPRALHTRFGRPLVINFWASWCGPCIAELDQFAAAREKYGSRIEIVTIAWSDPSAATYLESRGLLLPVIPDDGRRLSKAFGVSAVPVTLVLRQDGTVAHVSVGELDPSELDVALGALLAPAAPSATLTLRARSGTFEQMPGTPST